MEAHSAIDTFLDALRGSGDPPAPPALPFLLCLPDDWPAPPPPAPLPEPLTPDELARLARADPAATCKAAAQAMKRANGHGGDRLLVFRVAQRWDEARLEAEVTRKRAKRIVREVRRTMAGTLGRTATWREAADELSTLLLAVEADEKRAALAGRR